MSWNTAEIESASVTAIKIMGYTSFKSEQQRVVSSFVSGRDVFVALLTGFGKSLLRVFASNLWFFEKCCRAIDCGRGDAIASPYEGLGGSVYQ